MEATAFLGFALMVVIGITFLALLLEFLDPERRPASQPEPTRIPESVRVAGPDPVLLPAFFAKPIASQVPSAALGFDDGLFAFLQHHVKTEQAMVAEFVHLPSIDNLYRQARAPLTMH
jgi:hypothetical protein